MSESTCADERLRVCEAAAAKGYEDPESLRELLICTTSTVTARMAEAYFAERLDDTKLLILLIALALEGEDAGDAPWAAANTIAEFPAEMLLPHKQSLEQLAAEDWTYLHVPGRNALAKIASSGGGR